MQVFFGAEQTNKTTKALEAFIAELILGSNGVYISREKLEVCDSEMELIDVSTTSRFFFGVTSPSQVKEVLGTVDFPVDVVVLDVNDGVVDPLWLSVARKMEARGVAVIITQTTTPLEIDVKKVI